MCGPGSAKAQQSFASPKLLHFYTTCRSHMAVKQYTMLLHPARLRFRPQVLDVHRTFAVDGLL